MEKINGLWSEINGKKGSAAKENWQKIKGQRSEKNGKKANVHG